MSLQGRTVALAEGRQLEELAQLLHAEGASVLRCPMIGILDAPDPAPVDAWLGELIAGRFDYVILLTGEGLRRLLPLAERQGTREAAVAALAKTRIVVRGPKPVRALREIGLTPGVVAAAPTTEGVIASLCDEPLHGVRVGVQLYSDSNPPLVKFLEAAGATVSTVQPYVYAPATDAGRVVELIERLQEGMVNALVFTSSPQVDRLFEVAGERQLEAKLRDGFVRTCVAVVGPLIADTLGERGVKVDVMPPQGFVMKNLVQHLKRHFASGHGG
jgi:uroporphyrinogen-III synthase